MKKALCLAVVLAMAAPSAFGQSGIGLDEGSYADPGNQFPEAPIYYRPVSGGGVEALELARLIRDMLEKSRQLNRVDVFDEEVMQVEAPTTVVKSADGKKVTVTYDLTPARGGMERSFKAECPVGQLDRCADTITHRAERLARESIDRVVR